MTGLSSCFQKTNQDKYSSDAFLSSLPQISLTPPALDAILSAESDSHFVTDLFTCVIVSLLLCDVICVALCSPNFQAVSVSETTADRCHLPDVSCQMTDDQLQQACVGLNTGTFVVG